MAGWAGLPTKSQINGWRTIPLAGQPTYVTATSTPCATRSFSGWRGQGGAPGIAKELSRHSTITLTVGLPRRSAHSERSRDYYTHVQDEQRAALRRLPPVASVRRGQIPLERGEISEENRIGE